MPLQPEPLTPEPLPPESLLPEPASPVPQDPVRLHPEPLPPEPLPPEPVNRVQLNPEPLEAMDAVLLRHSAWPAAVMAALCGMNDEAGLISSGIGPFPLSPGAGSELCEAGAGEEAGSREARGALASHGAMVKKATEASGSLLPPAALSWPQGELCRRSSAGRVVLSADERVGTASESSGACPGRCRASGQDACRAGSAAGLSLLSPRLAAPASTPAGHGGGSCSAGWALLSDRLAAPVPTPAEIGGGRSRVGSQPLMRLACDHEGKSSRCDSGGERFGNEKGSDKDATASTTSTQASVSHTSTAVPVSDGSGVACRLLKALG